MCESGERARVLDDFSQNFAPNKVPQSWEKITFVPLLGIANFFKKKGEEYFQFKHEGTAHYIHMRSGAQNFFTLGSKNPFQISAWPWLSWEWKISHFPTGGNVRVKKQDDQAGSICVATGERTRSYQAMCYLWENTGASEEQFIPPSRKHTRYLILRSREKDGVGVWRAERRNILEDYRSLFGALPEKEVTVALLIDSDSTSSKAEAFYRRIRLCTSEDPGGA